ncbi:MAG: hypothetical protein ACTSU2_15065 [Promethearchaeota archaeon]
MSRRIPNEYKKRESIMKTSRIVVTLNYPLSLFRQVIKTKIFKILLILFFIWLGGFIYFLIYINPDPSKTPGDPAYFLRDIVWVFYWRWNLDYLMISFWFLVIMVENFSFRHLQKFISKEKLSVWVSPVLTMGFSYLYMLAIDVGVTYFADTGFNGTWESATHLLFGLTPRELYHDFFFWLIPIIIFCSAENQIMIWKNSYSTALKAWFVMMAVYSLNLGLLDPVVCQVLWGDWRLFGNWAMGGADPIWAEGWIAHYIIFALIWVSGVFILDKLKKELNERDLQ